ncbi:MAG: hypothetical protein K2I72_02325, partial [Bacilli bacterium]|nr:hypothetical protein [Bacilli bacterium]
MQMNKEELSERNEWTELYNELGSNIEMSLREARLNVRNLYEVAKRKNYNLENLFHSRGKNYYTESKLGLMLQDCIKWQLLNASDALSSAIMFENIVWVPDLIRIPIKNPFVKKYDHELNLMESLAIDETLASHLGSMLTEKRYKEEMLSIVEELKELG